MKTIELDQDFDLIVENGNLAIQRDPVSVVRQNILNKLSLVKGEYPADLTAGLNLSIIFGDNVPFAAKENEIRRVIFLTPEVVSVDRIDFVVDPNLRVGYFTCYITITIDGTEMQTAVGFGL